MVHLGDVFPNFKADTTIGPIEFHEWIGGSSYGPLMYALKKWKIIYE
jgi:alkyl hydroperoxide reductase subunit AhpC